MIVSVSMKQMSPSKLSTFLSCPKKFEYKYIQQLPEESGLAAERGSLVHDALELLFDAEPQNRTLSHALACLDMVKGGYPNVDPDEAEPLIRNLFTLEDPTTITPIQTEMDIVHDWNGRQWRGIFDRIDQVGDELVILDYKTGKAPADQYLDEKALGIKYYGTLAQELGMAPSKLVLLYLGTPQRIEIPFTLKMGNVIQNKVIEAWDAIERCEQSGIWKAKPSFACGFCSFKDICPEYVDKPRKKS